MKFYISQDNILPVPTAMGIYTEAGKLEKLFTQQWPYPENMFAVIHKRAKTCEEWLWRMGDQNTSCAIRHQLEMFQKNVQYGRRYEEIK